MKLQSTLTALTATAALVSAAPTVQKRQAVTDADILNYALTLEHLEYTFYTETLANYTEAMFAAAGFNGTFYNNLMEVKYDEMTHVNFLTAGLIAAGATPVAACTYDFPVTTVMEAITLASVLEGVGVSAYLGAAALIMNATYLTDAGSILTVESRHSAYLRSSLMESPFPQPFDDPLDLDEVYSLASQYIVACPASNPPLPVKAFPILELSPSQAMPVMSNQTITLLTPGYVLQPEDGATIYGAFIYVTGPIFVPATAVSGGFTLMVPPGINGQSYVVLTSCDTEVTDDTIAAGPAIVEIMNPTPPI